MLAGSRRQVVFSIVNLEREEKSRYYRENEQRNHYFGNQDDQNGQHLKQI